MAKRKVDDDGLPYTCQECGFALDAEANEIAPSKAECETCHPWIRWRRNGWHDETCGVCRGTGMVADYSAYDFEGAKDCTSCNSGVVWVSPKGRHAEYPGGRFL